MKIDIEKIDIEKIDIEVEGEKESKRVWSYTVKCNDVENIIKADKSLTLDEIKERL